MAMRFFLFYIISIIAYAGEIFAQSDTTLNWQGHHVTLTPVVVGKGLDWPLLIQRIRDDSSFYKAFKNLRILEYAAVNDVRMLDRKKQLKAWLHSTTVQHRSNQCRTMEVLSEKLSGDVYNKDHGWNYYTMAMYASLFFTKGKVCNETNVIQQESFTLAGKSGIEKHKEQLKMLFFNPGKRIDGIPMVSNKTGIFDDVLLQHYDLAIDYEWLNGRQCLSFTQKVKPESVGQVVVDEMKTWLDEETNEVLARNYHLSFDAGIYDFDVRMEVVMTHAEGLLVPSVIRYVGDWKLLFKSRERGVFTATLSGFKKP